MNLTRAFCLVVGLLLFSSGAFTQEEPYFVTYTHHMAERGNLELETSATVGIPRSNEHTFFAPYEEFEYGVTNRWTAEIYLEGQSTVDEGAVFTGWRLENRYRPFARDHAINPVLYVEFEDINEASRILKEVVGNASRSLDRNSELLESKAREVETKLIFSSTMRHWNVAENIVVEKNLSKGEGFEFGYSFGVYRPLAPLAAKSECRFCRNNLSAGIEFYGGLGTTEGFGLRDTAHYAAPALSWQISDESSIHFSPAIGLTHESIPVLLRMGYNYEIDGFVRKVARAFGAKP